MKIFLDQWRAFLVEQTSYQGILKLELDPEVVAQVQAMQATLPEEAKRLDEKDLHVTLIHQSVLKPFKKQLKNLELPSAPSVLLEDTVWERESLGKKSWAVRLKNQEQMKNYVKEVMKLLGSQNTNPEPERIFHVSLANLTGNPHDSVR